MEKYSEQVQNCPSCCQSLYKLNPNRSGCFTTTHRALSLLGASRCVANPPLLAIGCWRVVFNTLRTGDADLRFYITTVQDG